MTRRSHLVRRYAKASALVWLGVVAPYTVPCAQAGHDPARSPYRDIRRGLVLRVVEGSFGGTRGTVPVAATKGPTTGLRIEYLASNVLTVTAGVSYANTTAFFVTA